MGQVTTWRSRFTAPPPACSRGGPGSARRCTRSRPPTSGSSSTAHTSWRTSGSAGPRTGTRAWNQPSRSLKLLLPLSQLRHYWGSTSINPQCLKCETSINCTTSRRFVSSSKYRGGLLHEMFHLFGIMHTQMRKDRDQHITVLRQNIQRGVGSLEYNVRIGFILICIST